MLKTTPFHERTSQLCEGESWLDWAGHLSANSYELDHSHEYYAVRTGCGMFDVSPLYKYHVRGRDALALLDRMSTRNVAKCKVGQIVYTAWCDDEGHIVDDGTIARLGEDFFRLTTAMSLLYWLEDVGFGMDVEIEEVSGFREKCNCPDFALSGTFRSSRKVDLKIMYNYRQLLQIIDNLENYRHRRKF